MEHDLNTNNNFENDKHSNKSLILNNDSNLIDNNTQTLIKDNYTSVVDVDISQSYLNNSNNETSNPITPSQNNLNNTSLITKSITNITDISGNSTPQSKKSKKRKSVLDDIIFLQQEIDEIKTKNLKKEENINEFKEFINQTEFIKKRISQRINNIRSVSIDTQQNVLSNNNSVDDNFTTNLNTDLEIDNPKLEQNYNNDDLLVDM